MNPKHTLKEYADALARAGLLTATTLTPAAEGTVIDCLSYDTRSLHGTSLFLCKGAHFKAEYLSAALAQGAAAYVAEKPYPVDAPQLLVSDIRYAMVVLGQLFYDHVTDKLTSVGITGTKGKSTTAYYVRSILNDWLTSEGKPPCAILSSIDNYDGVITEESHITTPEVLELYQHFQNAYDSGISHLVMEVSSQALKVGRVRGMTFDVGAFLNIGTDHISPIEHPDFADYYASKLKLFDSCRVGCVNTDADHAAETIAHARSSGCELITFGSHASDTAFCERVEKRADGLYFTVRSPKYNGEFSITMPGLFNVSNALAAMAISMALGVPEEFVRSGLRKARANGRMQVYESRDKRVTVIVDYAHNRMSFDALYRSTRVEYPGKEMISVFGCPGSHALQRRRDGYLQTCFDLRRRNGLLQKLRCGNGKVAAFTAAQQIDQPKGHRVALRLDDRGLLLIAARLAQGAHQSAAHFSEIGGLIKAAEHREVAEEMRLQKAEEQARQQRPVPQPFRQRLRRERDGHSLSQRVLTRQRRCARALAQPQRKQRLWRKRKSPEEKRSVIMKIKM